MLPIPKKVRPLKDPQTERLYPETETLKLPPPHTTPKPLEQKDVTWALTRRHRETGYPQVLGPVGVTKIPLYFIDRIKDIADRLKSHKHRHGKTKHYYDTCAFYFPEDSDTLYQQGILHSHFSDYGTTLAKAEECLIQNQRNYKALLLKADTLYRICDFENALLTYSKGINLKFPYKNWFLDGYYRTTALLCNISSGACPMFYGGNMNVFYRLVQGQERAQKIFNDTYNHYDELFPLEPNLTGVLEEINMFPSSKNPPADHVQRRIKKAAIQQLGGARRILGRLWEQKMEIEKHIIKKEYHLPRFGHRNQSEKIEEALHYIKGRVDQFEVACAIMKNQQLREYHKPIDWMNEYGKWMAENKTLTVIPPAKTPGLIRYRWALSQKLFDMRDKPLDVCWVRPMKRYTRNSHILASRRAWRYYCGYKSAKRGALAALRNHGDDWGFMQKLDTSVWINKLENYAPANGALVLPKHILDIEKMADDFKDAQDGLRKASKLVLPLPVNKTKDMLYYDPEPNIEEVWDENRKMLKKSILKRDDKPSFLPVNAECRPIPANLLEVFETRVHDHPDAWEKRRKLSRDLREDLAKAEAVKAVHMIEQTVMFGSKMAHKHGPTKEKENPKDSEVEATDSSDSVTNKERESNVTAQDGDPKVSKPAPLVIVGPDDPEPALVEKVVRKERVLRKPGPRFKYDILNKKSEVDCLYKARTQRRMDRDHQQEEAPVVEEVVVQERVKSPEELEAERLLAAKVDNPFEIARRTFDNQKAEMLEKAYATLMTCTRVSEFLEIELEIGDLLDETFPPKNMRFPNGDPMILDGYPPPAPLVVKTPGESLGARKQKKKKYGDDGRLKPVTEAEAAREAAAVKRLMAEKGRRESVSVQLQGMPSSIYVTESKHATN